MSRGSDTVGCQDLQQALRQNRALAVAESAHVHGCDECLELWLDATVKQALDAKPHVDIPRDFAARMAASLPEKPDATPLAEHGSRHWGLLIAILLVAAGMVAMAATHPVSLNSWAGIVFLTLVVSEIAGIALWLGARNN